LIECGRSKSKFFRARSTGITAKAFLEFQMIGLELSESTIALKAGRNAYHEVFGHRSYIPLVLLEALMLWIVFALGAALAWGLYGPALHQGQVQLGSPMRALLCVGVAYFLIGVIVPVISLSSQGQLNGFNMKGSMAATLGGALGAIGAVCIIFAFKAGGLPTYVMPLVFSGAPLVNVICTMWMHPPKTSPNPLLYLGFVLAATGAGLVLYFKPAS
jgi:uncharacterized membrane protein